MSAAPPRASSEFRRGGPRDRGLLLPAAPLPTAHRVLLFILFALAVVLSLKQVGAEDTGFHLRTGEWLLEGRGWPGQDPFTFTVGDRPYIDTSWGYDLLLALINRTAGPAGMVFAHMFLVLGTFGLLYRTARLAPCDPTFLVVVLGIGIAASEMRYQVRPELVSYFLLSLELSLLHRHASGKRTNLKWLPVIHLAWANLHSLYILGWGAIACFVIGLWIRDRRLDRDLLRFGLASVAAAFLNPYGVHGVLFPFSLATRMQEENAFAQSIGEFVSPWQLGLSQQYPFYPRLPIWMFRAFAVLVGLSLIPLARRRRFPAILLAVAFLALSATMIRNVPLLVVAALPGVVWAFPIERRFELLGVTPRLRRAVLWSLLSVTCLGAASTILRTVNDAYYIESRRSERFGLDWNRLSLPLGVAEYAYRVDLQGHMLNHLNFGGHLMWALRQPVFIDGRLEVIGEDFYRYYLSALSGTEAMEGAVTKYNLRWMTFPYVTNPKLLGRVSGDPRWQLAYVDEIGVVFLRADHPSRLDASISFPPGPPLTPETLPGLGGPRRRSPIERWLRGHVTPQQFPSFDFNLGLFHLYRGELGLAAGRFADAIRASGGDYYEIYNNLGAVLFRLGQVEEARACYRVVLAEDPGSAIARERVGDR